MRGCFRADSKWAGIVAYHHLSQRRHLLRRIYVCVCVSVCLCVSVFVFVLQTVNAGRGLWDFLL